VVQPAAVEAAVLAGEEEAHKQDDVLDVWLANCHFASHRGM